MKIGFLSLGCPKNLVDGEVMLGIARDAGHELTSDPSDADVSVLDRQLQDMQSLRRDELSHTVNVRTGEACACEKALAALQIRLARPQAS